MYYNVDETLTHNCLFNFIIGSRGIGKTYGLKKKAVKRFKDKGKQFVYLRRYDEELEETASEYFNDIIRNGEFPNDEITYKNGCYYLNGECMGYAMCLTKAGKYKSISLPDVWLIIFDEFLLEETGFNRYLRNEVRVFLSVYMSIDRYRGVIVFFLGNATTFINPYTLYFKINMPYGSKFFKRDDLLLQLVENAEFIEEKKQTRFGKLIEGTEFSEYAIDNKFAYDSKSFISKKTAKSNHCFSFIFMGQKYGVWLDADEGKMFVSENVDPYNPVLYAITNSDHNPNTMLLTNINKSPYFKLFINNYKIGNVYFESQKIKNVCYEVLRLCMTSVK